MRNVYVDSEYAKMNITEAFESGHLMEYLMGNVRPYRRTELRQIIDAFNKLYLKEIELDVFLAELKKAEKVAMSRPKRKLSSREENAKKARSKDKK